MLANWTIGTLLLVSWGAEPAPKSPAKVSFTKDVRPILVQHCQGCHQPARPLGQFVATSVSEMRKTGKSKTPGVTPGKPNDSELYLQVIPQGADKPLMPKGKPALLDKDVAVLRKWIEEGANDDTPAYSKTEVTADTPPVYVLPNVISSLSYSPDGKLLAVSGYHEVLLFNASDSKLVARLVGLSERVEAVAFSPDSAQLAVSGGSPGRFGEIQVWDVAKRKLTLSHLVTYDTLFGVSWSGDGKKIAFGCADNTLRAIDPKTGQQVLYQGAHEDWVQGTVFSKEGTHLISVGRDRSMKLTEVATQRFVDNITSITPGALKGGLLAVDRHPQKDELLAAGADGIPKVYRMIRTQARQIGDDFNLIKAYEGLPGRLYAAKFSPDGNLLAAGSSDDGKGAVRVYQVADGKVVANLEGQKGPVYALAFSSDGKTLASAGFDGMVRLNDPMTGKLLKEFVAAPMPSGAKVAGVNN